MGVEVVGEKWRERKRSCKPEKEQKELKYADQSAIELSIEKSQQRSLKPEHKDAKFAIHSLVFRNGKR